jgi:hypothetical protein
MTLDEMWQRLAQHQPYADERGYGEAWAKMCRERTPEAALDAARAATYLAEDMVEMAGTAWAALRAAEGKNND